jgi:hypothetical protein
MYFARPGLGTEDNIKMSFRRRVSKDVYWIQLTQDGVQWRVLRCGNEPWFPKKW